ncbi:MULTISPECIES: hypothetical protein [Geobacillus]|nr:hypothetical protein [Geobacillus genomosp. 3]
METRGTVRSIPVVCRNDPGGPRVHHRQGGSGSSPLRAAAGKTAGLSAVR